jgi:phage-related minor tail protein
VTAGASAASAAIVTGAATGGGTLTAAGAAVAASIVAAAIQAAAILQAQSTASAFTSVAASAKGNVFSGAGLHAFANGGAFTNRLFSVPTMFQFGRGGQFGVMGEAGPEAVMPLTRGPGGRLGVDAHGAGASRRPDKYVLAFGDDEIANAMAGAAGEAVWLLHARNNRDTFNAGG